MRLSEKDAKNRLKLPLGLVFEAKGKIEIEKQRITAKIGEIHAHARHYKVVNGEVCEISLKL